MQGGTCEGLYAVTTELWQGATCLSWLPQGTAGAVESPKGNGGSHCGRRARWGSAGGMAVLSEEAGSRTLPCLRFARSAVPLSSVSSQARSGVVAVLGTDFQCFSPVEPSAFRVPSRTKTTVDGNIEKERILLEENARTSTVSGHRQIFMPASSLSSTDNEGSHCRKRGLPIILAGMKLRNVS